MVTISLIGEQPIPNLLPIRYQPPEVAVLVYTDLTEAAAERLKRLLPEGCRVVPCLVCAYDIQKIVHILQALIEKHGWTADDLLFNLTGGTKAMALAAYLVAGNHKASFLYLQSEGKQTRLYRYEFDASGIPRVSVNRLLPGLITIDDYLRAYVDDYQLMGFAGDDAGGLFERAIYEALEPVVDEIVAGARLLGALDVDLVVRCENQVGIIEAKTGPGVKKGIDQLNTAGGQHYLGTYTRKMLVSDQCWDESRSNLRELAEARRIQVVELPSFHTAKRLSSEDVEQLQRTVCEQLGRRIGGDYAA
ncbi:MAG TPA: DUF1887 family protein [Anaerolineae bacterium]|nr:DUF1887 family protein [Anaerolineae bacterium]